MTISAHAATPGDSMPGLTGWHLLGGFFAFVAILLLLGAGSDPTRYSRHALTVASFDWVAPGLDAGVPGTMARYRNLDAAEGSLTSLASHELRNEQLRLRPEVRDVATRVAALHMFCDNSSLGDQLALGDRHGRFDRTWLDAPAMSPARDNRGLTLVAIRGLPAPVIPADEPSLCDVSPSALRLADFVAPPRLISLMGYLEPGYFVPV